MQLNLIYRSETSREDAQEGGFSAKDLSGLPTSLRVAQEVGEGLG